VYGHVKLFVEPLVGTWGFQFTENVTSNGSVPEKFLSHIELGILSASKIGLWGFPVSGFLVHIEDGSYHDVDSTASAFEKAAKEAFVPALLAASPVILEPTLLCIVSLPEEYMPAVLGELTRRRFRLSGTRRVLRNELEAVVPQSETLNLLPRLAEITMSTVYCSMHPDGYEPLPESLSADLYCSSCKRDMRIPLLEGVPLTSKCLICGTILRSPEWDAGVPVLKR
jgi:elongation factor G